MSLSNQNRWFMAKVGRSWALGEKKGLTFAPALLARSQSFICNKLTIPSCPFSPDLYRRRATKVKTPSTPRLSVLVRSILALRSSAMAQPGAGPIGNPKGGKAIKVESGPGCRASALSSAVGAE